MPTECRTVKKKKCRKCGRTFLTPRGLKQHKEWHKRSDAIRAAGGKGLVAQRGQRVAQHTSDGRATTPYEPSRYSGRAVSLQTLDQMLKEAKSQKRLKNALRTELMKNPVKFFKEIVMPNMPKAALLRLEQTDQPTRPPVLITFAPQTDLEASIPTVSIPTMPEGVMGSFIEDVVGDQAMTDLHENIVDTIGNCEQDMGNPHENIIDVDFSSQNKETQQDTQEETPQRVTA